MIITILAVAILVTGIVFNNISNNTHKIWPGIVGFICTAIGGIAIIAISMLLIVNNVDSYTNHIKKVDQRKCYESIIQSEDKLYLASDFYDAVIDFNQEINNYKMCHDNPWVNWFWNNIVYEGIEPVELWGGEEE